MTGTYWTALVLGCLAGGAGGFVLGRVNARLRRQVRELRWQLRVHRLAAGELVRELGRQTAAAGMCRCTHAGTEHHAEDGCLHGWKPRGAGCWCVRFDPVDQVDRVEQVEQVEQVDELDDGPSCQTSDVRPVELVDQT